MALWRGKTSQVAHCRVFHPDGSPEPTTWSAFQCIEASNCFLLLAGGLTQWCLSSATMSSIPHNNYKSSAAAAGRWVGSLGSQRSQIVSCKPALAAVDSFTINDLLCIKQPNLDHTPPLSPPSPPRTNWTPSSCQHGRGKPVSSWVLWVRTSTSACIT